MRAVALVFVMFAVVGCTEEEESFELNARRIAELATATCSCSDNVSKKTCSYAYEASLNADLLAQVQAGRVQVNGALWTDCIDELVACEAPDVCEKLFVGTLAEDGECVASQECAPGLRCVAEDPSDAQCSSAGTCQEIATFGRGEPCDRQGTCEGDELCGAVSSGEAPSDDDAGVEDPDAGSDDEPAELELICQKPIEKGEPCPLAALGDEGTALCEPGTGCVPDGDDVVCGDPVEPGEPCTFGISGGIGLAKCTRDYFCDAESGVCRLYDFPIGGDIGEDCDMKSPCLAGLVCIDEACASPLPNGSECDDDDQCAAQCSEGRCAATHVACGIQ